MSKTLFALAVIFLFAVACNAQTAQVWDSFYSDDQCNTASFNSTMVNAGSCNWNGAGSDLSWYSYYCSTDGAYVYRVTFDDMNCTTPYQVQQYSTGCDAINHRYRKICSNPQNSPASPVSFPPSGWATYTSCHNASATGPNPKPVTVCAAAVGDKDVRCMNGAMYSGFCHKVGRQNVGQIGSTAAYCAADGSVAGQVFYTDNMCSTIGMAQYQSTGCNNGMQITCGSNAASFPDSVPTKGFMEYDRDDCTVDPNNAATTTVFADGCVNSNKFQCVTVNGTAAATWTEYNNMDGKGLCTDQTDQYTQFTGSCVEGRVFSCDITPPSGGNSAAAASVSAIVMIVAAFVAMIAGRSL
jgi:hypothetical protein